MLKVFKYLIFIVLIILFVIIVMIYQWSHKTIAILNSPITITIQQYDSLPIILMNLRKKGINLNFYLFKIITRFLKLDKSIKFGCYTFHNGITPYKLLLSLIHGNINKNSITIIEGWTFKQMREKINKNHYLRHDTLNFSEHELLSKIGANENHAEGLFFPDTYYFTYGISDLVIYKNAYQKEHIILSKVWKEHDYNIPYTTPYEVLIIASIIERESKNNNERTSISAVFANRINIGMPLQSDVTILYGLSKIFHQNSYKYNNILSINNPYNTYIHHGLPPTPISLPGKESLLAAVHPAKTNFLYFVAQGNGFTKFSNSLAEHNKAVHFYYKRRK